MMKGWQGCPGEAAGQEGAGGATVQEGAGGAARHEGDGGAAGGEVMEEQLAMVFLRLRKEVSKNL